MEESGVKTEGGEVIPSPPDSLGKKKKSDLFPANIYSTFWDLKPTKIFFILVILVALYGSSIDWMAPIDFDYFVLSKKVRHIL